MVERQLVESLIWGGDCSIIGLILAHALVPSKFLVDSTTIGLLAVLGVIIAIPLLPFVTNYISELTFMGNTVKFREGMERAEELAEVVERQAEESRRAAADHPERKRQAESWPGFISVSDHLYRLLDEDPRLAVAGLGIHLEEMLREAALRVAGEEDSPDQLKRLSLGRVIQFLQRREWLTLEQAALLGQLAELRNLAVHGREITRDDALRFFALVERLNESVPLGYSIDFKPNENWEEQGLICKYEHCIEHMPLPESRWEGSCEIFGHDCPGGPEQVDECRKAGVFAEFRVEDEAPA